MKLRKIIEFFETLAYTEKYVSIQSFIHNIDPKIKVFYTFAIILTSLIVKDVVFLTPLVLLLLAMAVLSKVSLRFFLFRATIFIPAFTVMIALPMVFLVAGESLGTIAFLGTTLSVSSQGVQQALILIMRVWISVGAITLLILTTRFSKTIQAIDELGAPRVFTLMLGMTYRYIFVFIEEIFRIALAKEARTAKKEGWTRTLKSFGNLIGVLFIRSYERGERVHQAMLARGYGNKTTRVRKTQSRSGDWFFLAAVKAFCMLIFVSDLFYLGA